MISPFDVVALVLAGALAGLIGSAGGITSLVSYPALLLVGLGPLPASIANYVALVACWPGSALASRPELAGQVRWLTGTLPVAAAGGAAGAGLLLITPSGAFARVVPFLVLLGSLALLAEPRLTAWRGGRASRAGLGGGLALLSLYNGYFGAGSGVMVLTLMLVLGPRGAEGSAAHPQVGVERPLGPDRAASTAISRANALKNMVIGAGCVTAATLFTIIGPVRWSAVVPLGAGMFIGANIGPRMARRLPERLLRLSIVVLGIGLAAYLWVDPGA